MAPADVEYLASLRSVREQCFRVQEVAARNQLQHFEVDQTKFNDMVQYVLSLMKRDFDDTSEIPVHGRWRHFDIGGRPRIQNLINSWASLGESTMEQTRRVLDLFVVSVLLDIETDHTWSYQEQLTGRVLKRNEGIAVACLEMFTAGAFSSDPSKPHRVDSEALFRFSLQTLAQGFQIDPNHNLLVVLQDRVDLLRHLGQVLQSRQDYFGADVARPGNLMDYLLAHPTTINTKKGPLIHLETLWPVVQEMGEAWTYSDNSGKGGTHDLGDVWPCKAIQNITTTNEFDHWVSFHRLSQWLVYSLIEPMVKLLGATIEGTEQLTVLPEYRNGGLLIDTGFLTLKQPDLERGLENYRKNALLPGQPKVEIAPMFEMSDPVVVEWRALTVAYLDIVAERVRETLGLNRKKLSLSQLIQGGTWSAGRELAEISRPNTQEPPIVIKIDRHVIY
ncbi:hypothetical protein BDB00DRAFT_953304 [Zychaea mexicana]|uniref:uncharacterized protein n=1 Tax=Zychaea mexicana TaxID=64656 RepID=UPI0022FF1262|nr:uncharacterized protein BDB00DRAFT_953304 [Zychaea mexicana]KAI9496329.1 hypothetical protein BDB00DRAFT_953304 [Zychaea mexicana]